MNSLLRAELLGRAYPVPKNLDPTGFSTSGSARRSTLSVLRYSAPRSRTSVGNPGVLAARDSYTPHFSPNSTNTSTVVSPKKATRKISRVPYKVLDAPALADDYYLNLVDWSANNVLAVALGPSVFLWSASSSKVTKLCELAPGDSITSVTWAVRGSQVAVGTFSGQVQIWDAAHGAKIRDMKSHTSRVGVLAWSSGALASGSRDRTILVQDVRIRSNNSETPRSEGRSSISARSSYGGPFSSTRASLASRINASRSSIGSNAPDTSNNEEDEDGERDTEAIDRSQTTHLSDDLNGTSLYDLPANDVMPPRRSISSIHAPPTYEASSRTPDVSLLDPNPVISSSPAFRASHVPSLRRPDSIGRMSRPSSRHVSFGGDSPSAPVSPGHSLRSSQRMSDGQSPGGSRMRDNGGGAGLTTSPGGLTRFNLSNLHDPMTISSVSVAQLGSGVFGSPSPAGGMQSRLSTASWVSTASATGFGSGDPCVAQELSAHKQEVCGLKWSFDERLLASGGNDNKLYVWQPQAGGRVDQEPLCKFNDHTAAVKAVAWSPHQAGLLASGGGTADRHIRFWNASTGLPLHRIDTGSQVCNLVWSATVNEMVSTHGYSLNQIIVWKCPSMQKLATLTGHTMRVLYLAMSPDGQSVVTGAGDETLRFWNVFPGPRSSLGMSSGSSALFPSSKDIR